MFKEGFYKKLYHSIISKALTRVREEDVYYEFHHIIPLSLGGSNDKSNLVALTAKEHFICHYLLTKITLDEDHKRKMIWAFYMMRVDPVKGLDERKRSSRYELARRLYVENHPTKKKEIVEKIRQSTITFYSSEEYCQKRKASVKYTKCKCGCENLIEYYGKIIPKFLNKEHYFTYLRSDNKPPVSAETRLKQSMTAVKRIKSLTEDQRKDRMLKSTHRCDHVERGKRISSGKKGKSTSQQELMGKRYARMSDEEFKAFVYSKKRPDNIIRRMIKLRERYA